MQAVIMAAGKGTRMGELTSKTPKPLLKYHGETIISHDLRALPNDIDEIIIVVGYLKDSIKAEIGDKFDGKPIQYVEQMRLNGTAGALHAAKDKLHGRFLVISGDNLYEKADLVKLASQPLAILVSKLPKAVEAAVAPGTMEVSSEGVLLDIKERQDAKAGALMNAGAYVLNEDFFLYPVMSAGNPPTEYGLPQTMMQMVRDGTKFSVVEAQHWHSVTRPEDLE